MDGGREPMVLLLMGAKDADGDLARRVEALAGEGRRGRSGGAGARNAPPRLVVERADEETPPYVGLAVAPHDTDRAAWDLDVLADLRRRATVDLRALQARKAADVVMFFHAELHGGMLSDSAPFATLLSGVSADAAKLPLEWAEFDDEDAATEALRAFARKAAPKAAEDTADLVVRDWTVAGDPEGFFLGIRHLAVGDEDAPATTAWHAVEERHRRCERAFKALGIKAKAKVLLLVDTH